jgi:hypothetical protein
MHVWDAERVTKGNLSELRNDIQQEGIDKTTLIDKY